MDKKKKELETTAISIPGCSGKNRGCCSSNSNCYQEILYYPETDRTVVVGCC